jgi:hypothetical protein
MLKLHPAEPAEEKSTPVKSSGVVLFVSPSPPKAALAVDDYEPVSPVINVPEPIIEVHEPDQTIHFKRSVNASDFRFHADPLPAPVPLVGRRPRADPLLNDTLNVTAPRAAAASGLDASVAASRLGFSALNATTASGFTGRRVRSNSIDALCIDRAELDVDADIPAAGPTRTALRDRAAESALAAPAGSPLRSDADAALAALASTEEEEEALAADATAVPMAAWRAAIGGVDIVALDRRLRAQNRTAHLTASGLSVVAAPAPTTTVAPFATARTEAERHYAAAASALGVDAVAAAAKATAAAAAAEAAETGAGARPATRTRSNSDALLYTLEPTSVLSEFQSPAQYVAAELQASRAPLAHNVDARRALARIVTSLRRAAATGDYSADPELDAATADDMLAAAARANTAAAAAGATSPAAAGTEIMRMPVGVGASGVVVPPQVTGRAACGPGRQLWVLRGHGRWEGVSAAAVALSQHDGAHVDRRSDSSATVYRTCISFGSSGADRVEAAMARAAAANAALIADDVDDAAIREKTAAETLSNLASPAHADASDSAATAAAGSGLDASMERAGPADLLRDTTLAMLNAAAAAHGGFVAMKNHGNFNAARTARADGSFGDGHDGAAAGNTGGDDDVAGDLPEPSMSLLQYAYGGEDTEMDESRPPSRAQGSGFGASPSVRRRRVGGFGGASPDSTTRAFLNSRDGIIGVDDVHEREEKRGDADAEAAEAADAAAAGERGAGTSRFLEDSFDDAAAAADADTGASSVIAAAAVAANLSSRRMATYDNDDDDDGSGRAIHNISGLGYNQSVSSAVRAARARQSAADQSRASAHSAAALSHSGASHGALNDSAARVRRDADLAALSWSPERAGMRTRGAAGATPGAASAPAGGKSSFSNMLNTPAPGDANSGRDGSYAAFAKSLGNLSPFAPFGVASNGPVAARGGPGGAPATPGSRGSSASDSPGSSGPGGSSRQFAGSAVLGTPSHPNANNPNVSGLFGANYGGGLNNTSANNATGSFMLHRGSQQGNVPGARTPAPSPPPHLDSRGSLSALRAGRFGAGPHGGNTSPGHARNIGNSGGPDNSRVMGSAFTPKHGPRSIGLSGSLDGLDGPAGRGAESPLVALRPRRDSEEDGNDGANGDNAEPNLHGQYYVPSTLSLTPAFKSRR